MTPSAECPVCTKRAELTGLVAKLTNDDLSRIQHTFESSSSFDSDRKTLTEMLVKAAGL